MFFFSVILNHEQLFIECTFYEYRKNSNVAYFYSDHYLYMLNTIAKAKYKHILLVIQNDCVICNLFSSIWNAKLGMCILSFWLFVFIHVWINQTVFPVNILGLKDRTWETDCEKKQHLNDSQNIQSCWLTVFSLRCLGH